MDQQKNNTIMNENSDDADNEIGKLISQNKKRRVLLEQCMLDNDQEQKGELWKNSGVFVNALELADAKRSIKSPGAMACRLMRLALGQKLIGLKAKRGKEVVPQKYFDAVYCGDFELHSFFKYPAQ